MQLVTFLLIIEHAGIGLAEHRLVKLVAEALRSLFTLLVDLLLDLGNLVLDKHISAVALLAVAVVDQGIVKRVHVARSLPDGGVHKDGAVDAHDVLVQQRHGLPPVALDVILEFDAILSIVIDCAQAVIDFT